MAESRPSNVTLNINGNRTEDQSRAVYGWIEGDVHQHFHSSANPSDAQEREVIARLKDLSTDPHVIRERLISSKDKRVPGTCEWITNNATYRAWLAVDSDTRLLWISGGPGKGKTMMSIFLTEELERLTVIKDDAEVVYFFCLNGEEERNTATAVLRGLVYQITTKRPQLVRHAVPYFETEK